MHDDFRERIENILTYLREIGQFSVYCAAEDEGWRISQEAPGVSMARNFKKIAACSTFLALVDKTGSDGRGVETEYARNCGCKVYLATGPGEELGWVMQEIVALERARHIPFNEPEELAMALHEQVYENL